MSNDQESWTRYLIYLQTVAEQTVRRVAVSGLDPSSIAQTALTEAWRSRTNFRGEGEEVFLAWLRGILGNVMRTAVRNQIRRPQTIDISSMDFTHTEGEGRITVFARPATSPVEELQRKERALLVVLALEKLSSDHREVLVARHFGEYSFLQIALQMNRTEAATRMLWVRALRSLRQIFLEEQENSGKTR